jgi:hypothetical protein
MTTPRPEFEKAEAETVMFAASGPVSPPTVTDMPAVQETAPSTGRHARHRPAAATERPADISARRRWLSRGVLLVVLLVQTLLTLRLSNTAFEDEALYLYVGHLEILHLLHGAALQGDYPSYFSGAPVLYPVLGAIADHYGGLALARGVSLIEMLAVTCMVYGMTRRMFNERVALCAALIFSVSESTLFVGHLATYDASALFLLAVGAWIVVRTATVRAPLYLLAGPVLVLAVATKYASLLWVPSVIALAGLAAWPWIGWRRSLLRVGLLAVTVVAFVVLALHLGGHDYLTGIDFSTLRRSQGDNSVTTVLWSSMQWVGLQFLLAVFGAVGYTMRPATDSRLRDIPAAGSRLRRGLLGAVMAGSALLAPLDQAHVHTLVSLQKHVGFGLLFAAPIAGVGLVRVVGAHFRRAQIGVAIWGGVLALGMTQASDLYTGWPNTTVFTADMAQYLQPGAHYLVEVDEVPIYYLRRDGDAQPDQFTSTYFFGYVDKQGQYLTGDAAYTAAIKAGYFRVVAFNYLTTPGVDAVIDRALAINPDYRLADVISGNLGKQYIWVKTG